MHQNEIDSVLAPLKYKDKSAVKKALNRCLYQVKTLRPKNDVFVSNTGKSFECICLYGTIPIVYRGKKFHIPIKIYIAEFFPFQPPICYVNPTQGMYIKPKHKHVDTQGLIYLPYLNQWNINNSSLESLIGVMASVFSQDPPLYKNITNIKSNETFTSGNPSYLELKEKVKGKIKSLIQFRYAEIAKDVNALINTESILKNESTKRLCEMEQLKVDQNELKQIDATIESKIDQINSFLSEREKNPVDFGRVVVPADTWSEQAFECVASDRAIDDTLFALDEALGDEYISLQNYLKQISKLGREQFLIRALIRKIYMKQNQQFQKNHQTLKPYPILFSDIKK